MGEPPVTRQHCQGQMPYYLQSIGGYSPSSIKPSPVSVARIRWGDERLGGGRMRAGKHVESGTWYRFITLHAPLCLLADCEGAGGAGASRHQWRAIQRISISWQPAPVTPALHPGVSRLHFRS